VDQFYIEFDRFMNQSNDDLIKFLIVEFWVTKDHRLSCQEEIEASDL
jgi:hypothetical protein